MTREEAIKRDLISRADAIRVVENNSYRMAGLTELKLKIEIEALPSADRESGEWEEMGENKDGTHNIRCNQCGESFKARGHANSHKTKKKYRFCPSCGADMRGEEIQGLEYAENILDSILREQEEGRDHE